MGERNEGTLMEFENVLVFITVSQIYKYINRILKSLHHHTSHIIPLHKQIKENIMYNEKKPVVH